MREIVLDEPVTEVRSFTACLATILELPLAEVPQPLADEDPAGWRVMRGLGGLGMGLVPVADAAAFEWAGPWLGWVRAASGERRAVVMFGVPAGVVWDPAGVTAVDGWRLDGGYVVAALDIALARPPRPEVATSSGVIESIWIAAGAAESARSVTIARAIAGHGLDGDRHVAGTGTFPSGMPGSALTLIEAEVCESFVPPLGQNEHRRNIVTRGIELARLVGHEFVLGTVRCRGVRLCEPCTVIQRYASRPILRALVHRGGLRADILEDGEIRVGDLVKAVRG